MSVTIYHNPRCSKSRQTLALIEEAGHTPEIVLYLQTPPSAMELKNLIKQLNLSASDLLRKGEDEYKNLGLKDATHSDDELIDMMVKYPKLIERPIVTYNGKAVLGRPPENVNEIL